MHVAGGAARTPARRCSDKEGELIMMKTLRVILCALLLVVVGASTATATHGRPDLQVPIQGYLVGVDEVPDMGAPGCEGDFPPDGTLLWRFTTAGTGRIAHLGRVDFSLTHCTHVDFTIMEGVLTISAANGDSLVLTYTGNVTQYEPGDPVALMELSWAVDSGTGRFANATGSGEIDGVTHVPPAGEGTELSLSGTIAYDASNRSNK